MQNHSLPPSLPLRVGGVPTGHCRPSGPGSVVTVTRTPPFPLIRRYSKHWLIVETKKWVMSSKCVTYHEHCRNLSLDLLSGLDQSKSAPSLITYFRWVWSKRRGYFFIGWVSYSSLHERSRFEWDWSPIAASFQDAGHSGDDWGRGFSTYHIRSWLWWSIGRDQVRDCANEILFLKFFLDFWFLILIILGLKT